MTTKPELSHNGVLWFDGEPLLLRQEHVNPIHASLDRQEKGIVSIDWREGSMPPYEWRVFATKSIASEFDFWEPIGIRHLDLLYTLQFPASIVGAFVTIIDDFSRSKKTEDRQIMLDSQRIYLQFVVEGIGSLGIPLVFLCIRQGKIQTPDEELIGLQNITDSTLVKHYHLDQLATMNNDIAEILRTFKS